MGASFSATTLSPTRMSARAACESLATAVTRLRSSRVRPKSSEDRGVFSSSAECVAPSGLYRGGGVTVKTPLGGKGRGHMTGSRRPSGRRTTKASPALTPAGAWTSIGAGAPGPCHRQVKRPWLGKGVGQRSTTVV